MERSDVVIQIVDARNPMLFRSDDLVNYVKELGSEKQNFLLLNKSDLLTEEQRQVFDDTLRYIWRTLLSRQILILQQKLSAFAETFSIDYR